MRRFVVERPTRLDRIALEAYGSEKGGTVERLLEANPGLADHTVEVPAGTLIEAPEIVTAEAVAVRPWI